MPWNCCGTDHIDTVRTCPTCGTSKVRWTMLHRATRIFMIPRKKVTWVELELKDALGHPLAGERFRVVAHGGGEHEGALDGAGFARIDGLAPGPCRISFVDLDGAEWDWDVPPTEEEEPGAAPAESAPPPAWVELELHGTDGRPLAGERYRLELPDGEVREGELGPDGRAREEDVPQGVCKVSFPELDGGEWDRAAAPSPAAPPAQARPAAPAVATG